MVAAGLIKPGDQMRAPGTGGAGADREVTGELRLAGGGESRAFFVTHPDPFNLAASNRGREGIERVADQPKNLPDTYLFKHADQDLSNRLGHMPLPSVPFDREQNFGERRRSFAARPVALELASELNPAYWLCAGLRDALERGTMGLR